MVRGWWVAFELSLLSSMQPFLPRASSPSTSYYSSLSQWPSLREGCFYAAVVDAHLAFQFSIPETNGSKSSRNTAHQTRTICL
ncbi:hypothetical protein K469DRAFT_718086 [Zopfia rhizophila CBS 207.26]|uniref:Secreted protein n=1 Tax=Zopfia rhizophila CBS 207.26 TaxID=1314779 RepID=A0A6A6DGF5_9PEZI|nr:hypothetical protein K469DRAFT_718086 [Zopfia rhizophila CBS 207.26]